MKKLLLSLIGILVAAQAFAYQNSNLNLVNGVHLQGYSDLLTTRTFNLDASTGNIGLPITAAVCLDGTSLVCKAAIFAVSANELKLSADGFVALDLNATAGYVEVPSGFHLSIASGKQLNLDGPGGSNYWINTATGVNKLFANGTEAFETASSGSVAFQHQISVPINNAIILNGSTGSDYIANSGGSADVWVTNSIQVFGTDPSGNLNTAKNLTIPTGQLFCLDGPTCNNRWANSGSNQTDLYTGGSLTLRTKASELYIPPVDPPTPNYANSNSFVKASATATGSSGGVSINSSYNISGISRTSAGFYVVTLSTPFAANANNQCVVSLVGQTGFIYTQNVSQPTFQVIISNAAASANIDAAFSLICVGQQ